MQLSGEIGEDVHRMLREGAKGGRGWGENEGVEVGGGSAVHISQEQPDS